MNTFFEQIEKARKIVHNGSVYYCAYDIEQNLASINIVFKFKNRKDRSYITIIPESVIMRKMPVECVSPSGTVFFNNRMMNFIKRDAIITYFMNYVNDQTNVLTAQYITENYDDFCEYCSANIDNVNYRFRYSHNICYIMHEREFIKTSEPIYKIGKTTQTIEDRLKQYPNGTKLITWKNVENCHKTEQTIIKQFTEHFIHRTDIGNEYFEGTLERMLEVFNNCCKQ